jgi:hypothetical protein
MRLTEFAPTKLSTLLTFLANRIDGENKEMPMNAVISMAQKMGIPLSYPALKKAYDDYPELQNLIADITQDSIILKSPDEVDNDSIEPDEEPKIDPDKKVDQMAKRALSKRESVEEDLKEDYARMTKELISKLVKQGKSDKEIQQRTGETSKRIEIIRKNLEPKNRLEQMASLTHDPVAHC